MSALAPVVPERDRRRIIAATSLLASDKDGEVVAAARAACRMLAPYGVTPAQLIESALSPAPFPFAARDIRGEGAPIWNHREVARDCLGATEVLNDWEVGFLISISRERSLTEKQRDKLKTIRAKIGREFRS